MILKMSNKDENFYKYMGKIFGSRIVERQTNDRIYDDEDKEWYIYLKNEFVLACVSISKNVIKNIYTTEKKYLEEILEKIQKDIKINNSIVTNKYIGIYEKCNFKVNKEQNYKNFVRIFVDK